MGHLREPKLTRHHREPCRRTWAAPACTRHPRILPISCSKLFSGLQDLQEKQGPNVPRNFERVEDYVQRRAASGAIDGLSNLAGKRVFVFAGGSDSIVHPSVGRSVERQARALTASGTGAAAARTTIRDEV